MPNVYPATRVLSLALALCLGCATAVRAQDVESFWSDITTRVTERDFLRTSGSLRLSTALSAFSSPDGARRRSAPFTWGAAAGVNFDLLGIQAPFSLAVSSRDTRYNLPSYAFAGLSPSYKWVTLHGGDRAMTLGKYTMSGLAFTGAGAELTPGRWTVAGFAGRLRTERILDVGADQSGIALDRRRMARALKVGYAAGGHHLAATVFTSADEVRDVLPRDSLAAAPAYRPEANAILSVEAGARLTPLLTVEGTLARSVLTRDRTAPLTAGEPGGAWLSNFGLAELNSTSAAATAVDAVLRFAPAFGTLSVGYERVGPEYRSHGLLFTQADLENVTAGLTAPLFAERLTLAANVGIQRNGLDGAGLTDRRRFIGDVQLDVRFTERASATASVSNFRTTSRYRALVLATPGVDSIVLAQTQFSLELGGQLLLDDAGESTVSARGSLQRANLLTDGTELADEATAFTLISLAYAYQPERAQGAASAGISVNRNATATQRTQSIGPTLSYRRGLFGTKGALTLAGSFLRNDVQVFATTQAPRTDVVSTSLQLNLGASYKLPARQSLRLALNYLQTGAASGRAPFSDLRADLNYGISF